MSLPFGPLESSPSSPPGASVSWLWMSQPASSVSSTWLPSAATDHKVEGDGGDGDDCGKGDGQGEDAGRSKKKKRKSLTSPQAGVGSSDGSNEGG